MKQAILALSVIALVAVSAQAQTGPRTGVSQKQPKSKYSLPLVHIVPPAAPLVGGTDSCVTPDVLTGTGTFNFDNTTATTGVEGQTESICSFFGFTDNIRDVWFTWTAPTSGVANITTCNLTNIDTKFAIYNGTTCPTAGSAIACNDDECGGLFQSTLSFPCTAGNSYVIQLGNSAAPPPSTPGAGVFTLNVSIPPPNDACATPTTVTGLGPFALDNTLASTGSQGQAQAACNFLAINRDVWFTWTATFTGTAGARTCGQASFDTIVAVYGGAGCPAAAPLGCNDDSCASLQSEANFSAVSGQTYTIQIGSYSTLGGVGSFDIYQLPPPPANDVCSAPLTIVGMGPFPFDNTFATTGTEGQSEGLCTFFGSTTIQKDLWYTWTATFTGTADFRTCTQTFVDTKIAAYAGTGCPVAGTALGCNDDSCSSLQTECMFPCTQGQVYTIQLGLYPFTQTGGTGTFDVYIPPPPPSNDDCSTPLAVAGPGTYAFDTTSASTGSQGQGESLCLYFGTTGISNDLWYTWTASVSGTATFSTCGGTGASLSPDTKIAVYQGNGCPVSAAITCLDDDGSACPAATLNTTVSWSATCGTTYTIQLGRYPGAASVSGTYTFSASGSPCVSGTGYCFGDGSGTGCPCGNSGLPGNGCANSLNANGANLTATGSPQVSNDTLVLQGSGMPNANCLYFQGTAKFNGGAGSIFGDGLRCVGGTVIRLKTVLNSGGASSYPTGTDLPISVKGLVPAAGATREYQGWYRNSALFCVANSTFNLTNGLEVVWLP